MKPLIEMLSALLEPIPPHQRRLAPSALGQFIRYEQCHRYLRLDLYPERHQREILEASDSTWERFPPLSSRSGVAWERRVRDELLEGEIPVTDCSGKEGDLTNEIGLTRPGEKRFILQAGMAGNLEGWTVKLARPDLILIDRTDPDRLRLLIVDLKASREVRLEHRLQVATYALMARQIAPLAEIDQAVLCREPLTPIEQWTDEQRAGQIAAKELLGIDRAALLMMADRPGRYEQQVERTVLMPDSLANQIAEARFEHLPFHLSNKCDGCRFNQFCLQSARSANDLSLIPYMTERSKGLLKSAGVHSIDQLSAVEAGDPATFGELMATPSLGPRVRELVYRAGSYTKWQRGERPDTSLPETGYSSLPSTSTDLHPNLIRIFLDLQRDTTQGRVYMIGTLVSCLVNGSLESAREEVIVKLADKPVEEDQSEVDLVTVWLRDLLIAVRRLMTPSVDGFPSAPLHFYFWDDGQLSVLQDLVNRQHGAILGIESIMALMMQPAAFDTDNFSCVADEIQRQRSLPILCQSLQNVARWFGFPWSDAVVKQFHFRMFDSLKREKDAERDQLVPGRSRFRSEIPSEYAYLAWNAVDLNRVTLDEPITDQIAWEEYQSPQLASLRDFQEERLRALRHITDRLRTNRQTTKTAFDFTVLNRLSVRPERPIEAVREFIAVERHIELSDWRRIRSLGIDRRIQMGETLVGRYVEGDQDLKARTQMREAREKQAKIDAFGDSWRELTTEQRKPWQYSLNDVCVSLRMESDSLPISIEDALRLTRRRSGDFVVVAPARSVDSRLDNHEQISFQTTAKQVLYQPRAVVNSINADGELGITFREGGKRIPGFAFGSQVKPLIDGELYTLDDNPDSWPSHRQWQTVELIRGGLIHPGYALIANLSRQLPRWSPKEAAAQQRFIDGLNRFRDFDDQAIIYEPGKQVFIGQHGEAPVMLVQGPPGTGKSTTTGMAVWARIQAGLASGREYRVAIACKTHNATDVLLKAIWDALERLEQISQVNSEFFAEYFDHRIFSVPIFRGGPRGSTPDWVRHFTAKSSTARLNEARAHDQVIVGATTNEHGKLATEAWKAGNPIWDLVIVDEASQMSVPEFLVASVGLRPDGRVFVVGDHRQMPPIVKQEQEPDVRDLLDPYAMYRSIFDVIRNGDASTYVPIAFEESFRIHRDVAEFLRREVYQEDGINFHSRREILLDGESGELFSDVVLNASAAMILIVHDEVTSQQRNLLEQEIAISLLYALDEREEKVSAGVVVPHRAQRADLQRRILEDTGDHVLAESVDTIERFQGNEREVIIYSATESDPAYLRDTASFLFDPRRLTVAISRARQKLIVIASRSVFAFLPGDEKSLRDTAIWRNLAAEACTVPIWSGQLRGHEVNVFANPPLTRPSDPAVDS